MARRWRTGAALPPYARIARTIRRTITATVAVLFVTLSVHSVVTDRRDTAHAYEIGGALPLGRRAARRDL
jgi:hypothetical protein